MGGKRLGEQLEQQLKAQGRKPYVIPIGGSGATGTFGYLAASQEIMEQAGKGAFTDIINVLPSFLLAMILGHTLPLFIVRNRGTLQLQTGFAEGVYDISLAGVHHVLMCRC